MHELYFQPKDTWFGDSMQFYHEGKYYIYYINDTRDARPLGWNLIVTEDFVHYEDFGEVIHPGADDADDQFIFSGSVIRAKGKFMAFYTGYNRERANRGLQNQIHMRALSDDLIHWEKDKSFESITVHEGYSLEDWRDPFVFYDEYEGRWNMIFGGRKLEGRRILTGCVVRYVSDDLDHWTYWGDMYAPNLLFIHEMPDIFKVGPWWYLLASEYSDRNITVWRRSRSLEGPWTAPADDTFAGRTYSSARTVIGDDGKRYLLGWVATRETEDDKDIYHWGGTLVTHEISLRNDGSFALSLPEGMAKAFNDPVSLIEKPVTLSAADYFLPYTVDSDSGTLFKLEAKVKVKPGTRRIGVQLYGNADTGQAYEYIITPGENRLTFDKTPNLVWYQFMNRGMERPLPMPDGGVLDIVLVVDDTIATIYIGGVALCARMCAKPGSALSLYVVEGEMSIESINLSKGLKKK